MALLLCNGHSVSYSAMRHPRRPGSAHGGQGTRSSAIPCSAVQGWFIRLCKSRMARCGGFQFGTCSASDPLFEDVSREVFIHLGMARNLLRRPVFGFRYQSCLPPCRSSMHPACSSCRTRSVRFIRSKVPRLPGFREFDRRSNRDKDPGGSPADRRESNPVYGSPGIARNNRATGRRPAIAHTASNSLVLFYGQNSCSQNRH